MKTLDLSRLKAFPVDALKRPWDGERQIAAGQAGTITAAEGAGYMTPAMKRTAADLRPLNREAVRHLATLPGPGEAYHYLISERVALWDAIPAILDRYAPEVVTDLWISTLTFGATTAAELLAFLDTGRVQRVGFLISDVFRAKNGQLYQSLIPHLLQRGQKARPMRTHAKVIAFEFACGHKYVIESSSNLRSSKSVEQVSIIRDDGLYAFHAGWIGAALLQ